MKQFNFNYTMHNIRKIKNDNEIDRMLNESCLTELRKGFVEVGPDNYVMSICYERCQQQITNFKVRDSDVFVIGHPKTGTTWMQEMVWLIMNNLDYEGAKVSVYERCPFFEHCAHFDVDVLKVNTNPKDYMNFLNKMPNPRCFKTHLHWSLLPKQIQDGSKKPKIVCLLRNPKDTCVSFYYYCKLLEGYNVDFDQFCQLFLAGRTFYGPFWKSVLSVWKERHRYNLMFVKYADMRRDLVTVVKELSKFLERDFSDEEVQKLAKHLSFDEMKKNPAVNQKEFVRLLTQNHNVKIMDSDFIRKGVVGGYKSEMTEEQIKQFDEWTKKELNSIDLLIE